MKRARSPKTLDQKLCRVSLPSLASEAALAIWLSKGNADARTVPQYFRQYGGFTVGGRQKVYGNFVSKEAVGTATNWKTEALIVCDGGTSFWGATFDRDSQKIEKIEFNGSLR